MSKFTDYIDGFPDKTGTLAKYRLSERDQAFKYTRATTLYIIKRIDETLSIAERKLSYKLSKREASC